MSLFQSDLRKQIRNLPKILNFVKKIHYYCELFTSLLSPHRYWPGIWPMPIWPGIWPPGSCPGIWPMYWPIVGRVPAWLHLGRQGSEPRSGAANFTGLILGCLETKFCKKYALESSRRDLHTALLCTVLVGSVL